MSRIISVTNQKGGVGKTTTAVSLGVGLASRGIATLLVDLDPQGNATSSLGLGGGPGPGLYEALILEHPLAETVRESQEGLHVVPSSFALAGAEVEMVGMLERERRLLQALESVAERYAYILLDCPPSLGLLTINGLAAAHQALVPVQCEFLSLEGLGLLFATVERVKRHLNPSLVLGGVLLTMADPRTNLSREVQEEVRAHFPQTYRTVIPRSVRLSESPSYGQSIFRYAPRSPGALAYAALVDEVLARDGVVSGR